MVSFGYHTCEKCQAVIVGRRYKSDQRYRRHVIIWFIYDREKESKEKHDSSQTWKYFKGCGKEEDNTFSTGDRTRNAFFERVIWLTH